MRLQALCFALSAVCLVVGHTCAAQTQRGGPETEAATDEASLRGEGCAQEIDPNSIPLPGSAQLLWTSQVQGTRNYSCRRDETPGPSLALSNLTGPYRGVLYFTSPTTSPTYFYNWSTGELVGVVRLETGLSHSDPSDPKPVIDAAAPPGTLPPARLPVHTTGRLPPANYVIRSNITGGGAPKVCDAPPGQWVLVPYTATNTYYSCT